MSKITEMRRLVLHAADRLAAVAEQATESSLDVVRTSHLGTQRVEAVEAALATAAAIALAEQTLRFVASCMEDESEALAVSDVL
jgi:hypothetical protein